MSWHTVSAAGIIFVDCLSVCLWSPSVWSTQYFINDWQNFTKSMTLAHLETKEKLNFELKK